MRHIYFYSEILHTQTLIGHRPRILTQYSGHTRLAHEWKPTGHKHGSNIDCVGL